MTEKFDIGEHLRDLLATSRTHDDMSTEEIASLMEKLEGSEFWTVFMTAQEQASKGIREDTDLSGTKLFEGIYNEMQSMDDEERKEKGLEPRPWSEIKPELEMELEEEGKRMIEQLEAEVRTLDAEQRKTQGLEPRPAEELEAEMDLEGRIWRLQEMAMEYDEQKRKADGQGPSFWKGFIGEFKDTLIALEKDGRDGLIALTNMVSLCERADEEIRQERLLGLAPEI
ncbi:MAG: hypothetical protein Q9169_000431 [Polycauliona sp. 2 TL-2023]